MTEVRRDGQLIAGVVLVALGFIFALQHLAGVVIYGLYNLWPLIVTAFGVARLFGSTRKERASGLFLIFLSVWFLINTLRIQGLDWGESWPILLMLIGLSKLILPEDGRRSGGVLLLGIGAWAFVNVFEVGGLYWEDSWPIGLIIVGVYIIWRALFENRSASPRKELTDV